MTDDYYISQKQKLLKRFDKTAGIVRGVFVSRYGDEFADTIIRKARDEYEALMPHIPYVKGGLPVLNLFVMVSAWELAIYKAMKKEGKSAGEAWELCHEALKLRLERIPKFVGWVMRLYLFSNIAQKRARKMAARSKDKPFSAWTLRFVEGDGVNFDWGVDYTGCTIYEFMKEQGAEEFAPYVCLSDTALSDIFGWGLIRAETLADGRERCDFRFKKGGQTRISSKTTEVQETIERIRERQEGQE
jgi:hypothetical protein